MLQVFTSRIFLISKDNLALHDFFFKKHIIEEATYFRYVDMLNLMTYDMHGGSFDDKTGHNAPLKAHPSETGDQIYFNDVCIFLKRYG